MMLYNIFYDAIRIPKQCEQHHDAFVVLLFKLTQFKVLSYEQWFEKLVHRKAVQVDDVFEQLYN